MKAWQKWEKSFLRNEPPDYVRNSRLMESMYQEARSMGVFSKLDPLEGLDVKIRTAKILNV
ncbi:MAG: hypothetical protein A3C47_04800 [Omnitrophica bacterium RIFCSPHIGHO2_02_FULL_51_18]|nr:MAG: hypothetical protein A3C47_04800 [Omnitrophica bacterium RIFCSPHIGHO2_02_FULL_51_18]